MIRKIRDWITILLMVAAICLLLATVALNPQSGTVIDMRQTKYATPGSQQVTTLYMVKIRGDYNYPQVWRPVSEPIYTSKKIGDYISKDELNVR